MDPLPVTSDFRAGGWTGFSRQGRRRRFNFRYHPLVLDYFKRLGDGQIDAFNNCNAWVLDALRDAGPEYLENHGVINFMCAKDYSALLIPAREGMPVGTGYNLTEGNYNVVTGYKGDGATMYIDSGYNNNAMPQDDMQLSVYITEVHNVPAQAGVYMGGGSDASSGSSLLSRSGVNPSNCTSKLHDTGGASAFSGAGADVGFLGASRDDGTEYTIMTGQRMATISKASAAPTDVNLHVFRLNHTTPYYSSARISIFSASLSLDLTVMKEIQTGFMDRVLITSVYGDVWRGKDEATIQYIADCIRAGGGFG